MDSFKVNINSSIDVEVYKIPNAVEIFLISFIDIREKESVYTYTGNEKNGKYIRGEGFKDSDEINLIFQYSATTFLYRNKMVPDLFILHDGHTGLIPGMIESNKSFKVAFKKTRTLFIIHNAGEIYHQKINYRKIRKLNLIKRGFLRKAKVNQSVDPLILSSLLATPLTVSNYYADELNSNMHSGNDGGFGSFLNRSKTHLKGIVNGIDAEGYKYKELSRKDVINRLDSYLGYLEDIDKRALFLFQNRITQQKGIELLVDSIEEVLRVRKEANYIIMGEGEERYRRVIVDLVHNYPGNIIYIDWYSKRVSQELFNISDFFLITSLWEPCGLTDFEAILHRSIPIVRETGGLKKIENGLTGYNFRNSNELIALSINLLERFQKDKEYLDEFKSRAIDLVKNRYKWIDVVRSYYIPLIQELL